MCEIGFLMNGLFNNVTVGNYSETKLGDPGLQLKYQFIKKEKMAMAAVGKADFYNGATKFTVYAVPSFLTYFGQIDATAGISTIQDASTLLYAIAFSPKFDLPFGIYLELFGEKPEAYSPLYFDAGISYPVSSDFVLDIALVKGLNKDAIDLQFQIGLTKTLVKIF